MVMEAEQGSGMRTESEGERKPSLHTPFIKDYTECFFCYHEGKQEIRNMCGSKNEWFKNIVQLLHTLSQLLRWKPCPPVQSAVLTSHFFISNTAEIIPTIPGNPTPWSPVDLVGPLEL